MEAEILAGLVRRGMPLHIARGVVANMIVESRLDPGINEEQPLVAGSRGGFGLNQWTGPRRRAFEEYARARGADPSDLDTQLDFTVQELETTERGAGRALYAAKTPEEAARVYSDKFLRPGIPHMDRRVAEANRLAGIDPSRGKQDTPALANIDRRRALANRLASMQVVEFEPMDPRDYMVNQLRTF